MRICSLRNFFKNKIVFFLFFFSFKIFQHTSHNVRIFVRGFARMFLRLHQLQKDVKTVTIATENVDFMEFTDTKPENNWYSQFWLVRNYEDPGKMCLLTEIM